MELRQLRMYQITVFHAKALQDVFVAFRVYVCMCLYLYTCSNVSVCLCLCVHADMCVDGCAYVYVSVYMCMCDSYIPQANKTTDDSEYLVSPQVAKHQPISHLRLDYHTDFIQNFCKFELLNLAMSFLTVSLLTNKLANIKRKVLFGQCTKNNVVFNSEIYIHI